MTGAYAALAGRLRQVLRDVARVVERVEHLTRKAESAHDTDYLDGVALNLHGFYAGVERGFEDIARTVDQAVPAGTAWHQDLLLQMAAEVNAVRPPVLGTETRDCLDTYRAFRHVVRHAYTFNFQAARVLALASELRACYTAVEHDLLRFADFLEHITPSGEQ